MGSARESQDVIRGRGVAFILVVVIAIHEHIKMGAIVSIAGEEYGGDCAIWLIFSYDLKKRIGVNGHDCDHIFQAGWVMLGGDTGGIIGWLGSEWSCR